jgi:hypothetical protein
MSALIDNGLAGYLVYNILSNKLGDQPKLNRYEQSDENNWVPDLNSNCNSIDVRNLKGV